VIIFVSTSCVPRIVLFYSLFAQLRSIKVTQLLREIYSRKRTIAPFVSKITSSRLSPCRSSESLLYVDPSQFCDDGHSYTSNSVERKEGSVHFRATRSRTRHDHRIFAAISLAGSQFLQLSHVVGTAS